MPRVLCAGLATFDVIQLVDRLPHPDEKVAALDFLTAAGGPATNAAVASAWLGDRPTLVTALPRHPLSDLIADDLAGCGVDLAVFAAYDGAPITASIMITKATGERAVVSPTSSATDLPLDAPVPDLDGVGAVLIDGYFRSLSLPIARAARERGIPVILDAGSVKPYTAEVLTEVDIAVVSEPFARDGMGLVEDAGVERVVITQGGGPVKWRNPAGEGEVPVPSVPVVDTLGAGDFFHGALAWRIATQGVDDARLPQDIAFAASVVARSLGSFGTRNWLSQRP